jgi:hypothetical protein
VVFFFFDTYLILSSSEGIFSYETRAAGAEGGQDIFKTNVYTFSSAFAFRPQLRVQSKSFLKATRNKENDKVFAFVEKCFVNTGETAQ